MGSDHFPIFISINSKLSENDTNSNNYKFNYEKADWSTFHNLCKDITPEEVYSDNVNIFLDKLTKKILDRAELAIPATSSRPRKRKSVPWWNKECDKVVQDRKKAIYKLKKHPNPGNIEILKQAEINSKQVILEAKKQIGQNSVKVYQHRSVVQKFFGKKLKELKVLPPILYHY